jgi:hypothetical protein
MEIKRAIDAMARILHEERQRPTISYTDNLKNGVRITEGNSGTSRSEIYLLKR